MKFLILLFSLTLSYPLFASEKLKRFELRTYHASDGKLDELHSRFRDHTVALFEKHGMTNLIYWVPVNNEENLLIYLLGYPDREARDLSWKNFRQDPEWVSAYKESTKDGKLVTRVESLFLEATGYSPVASFPSSKNPLYYEMRKYTTNAGKLDALDSRFKNHTIELFEKHGLTNLMYFHLAEGSEDSENTLLYFISAPSEDSRNASFRKFGSDSEWKSAKKASEANGPLLVKNGVKSVPLMTTDYSPVR